jgi:membrane fusion protein, copper/silver efflux system
MKLIYLLIAGSTLMFAACNKKAAPETQLPSSEPKLEDARILNKHAATPDTFKIALRKVFEGYLQIQTALAQDDFAGAKEAFSSMHAVLHMMPTEGLDSAAKSLWGATDTRIMDVLHPMAIAENLDSTRAYFSDFSQILTEAIENFGIAGDGRVYQFHCPMAKGNQGANWLQSDSSLANPYFGKSMLTCGSLVRKVL